MKRTFSIVLSMLLTLNVATSAQEVESFVAGLLNRYPKSRLLDIYKSSFQDYMGAEHLVGDTASVSAYLERELASAGLDDLMPWYYEPCGMHGNYVRVSLRAVNEGFITAEALLDAFISSANTTERPSVEQWAAKWHEIVGVIDLMELSLPFYGQDKRFIDDMLSQGKYALSHSPEYRQAYNPHYRIVRRDIFERDILPSLPGRCCQ